MKMLNKFTFVPQNNLAAIVFLLMFNQLSGCTNTSKLSMDSIGEVNKPIKKVLIASRSNMSLKYREMYQGAFVSVVKEVLDKHGVKWTYSDNPRKIFNAYKKKNLSHTLLITTRQQQSYYRGTKRYLGGYSLSLALTELQQRQKVWEGEFVNEDVVYEGKNDKEKITRMVTEHFILAGIISAAEQPDIKLANYL